MLTKKKKVGDIRKKLHVIVKTLETISTHYISRIKHVREIKTKF